MTTLHSLWHQRHSYAWICLELILVAVFTWNVLDPLYFLTMNRAMPEGFDRDSVYVLSLKHREKDYDTIDKGILMRRWEHMNRFLQGRRDILLAMGASRENIYGTGSMSCYWLFNDSVLEDSTLMHVSTQVLAYNTYRGEDMVDLYGFNILPSSRHAERSNTMIWLSRSLATELYGTTDVVGTTVRYAGYPVVAGVFEDVRPGRYSQPKPLALLCRAGKPAAEGANIHLPYFVMRLAPGADATLLQRELEAEALRLGYRPPTLRTLGEVVDDEWYESSERNTMRLMRLLCSFALSCLLLGMAGTFWVRCAARRGDIAVMRALGATRLRVVRHFVTEALLLVTFSCLAAAPVIVAQVRISGAYGIDGSQSPLYPQNVLPTHCLQVSLLTCAVLMAVAGLGALAPVVNATRMTPGEGLKDIT